jgi:hypothetical protein
MLTETKAKLQILAEEYAAISTQVRALENKQKEIKDTILTAMIPGQALIGSDFELKCFEGKTSLSWCEDKIKVAKIQEELLKRGLMVSKTGLPYLRVFAAKSE